jgi:hypothetical protein
LIEVSGAIAPLLFRSIESSVGLTHDLFCVDVGSDRGCDSEAAGNALSIPVSRQHGLSKSLCRLYRVLAAAALKDDRKLLAAIPSGQFVCSCSGLKRIRNANQNLVSHLVTVFVVELLEVVNVEEHQREGIARVLQRFQRLVQHLLEPTMVP